MLTRSLNRQLFRNLFVLVIFFFALGDSIAQPSDTIEDSTVTYPAEFFAQFQPYSVNDMLQRIPGINLARGGGSTRGGPGSSQGGNRRGLGAGGDQVLINGRRIAGKENEGSSQLSRIPAREVDYIEIIRGTSGDLDVRGGTQVINIVLTQDQARTSFAYEVNLDRALDGEFIPGGKFSATGQRGALNYFLSAEREPRYNFRDGFETAFDAEGNLAETVNRDTIEDAWPMNLVANFGYEFSSRDTANFNLQWTGNDNDQDTDREIRSFEQGLVSKRVVERDIQPTDDDSWEVGGDYMHFFPDGSRWKTLFILNQSENLSVRSRYKVDESLDTRDLFLSNFEKNQERIIRSSYIFDFSGSQSIEAGVERAQTILDTSLQLGLLTGDEADDRFGGLTPITDSMGTVEEMRYEYFAIHNSPLVRFVIRN